MKTTQLRNILAAALACALTLPALAADDKKVKEQNEVRKVAHKTLAQLYKAQPKAKTAVANAAGYAAFNNMGVKILFAGSGKGKGLAVNNQTRKETFMKMLELQAGLGVGVKKFSVVFVFDTEKAFDAFVNSGWEFGGQATAAAQNGDKGDRWLVRRRFQTGSGCIR